MSSYLQFRKKGVELCEFSRSTELYQVFPQAPVSDWAVVSSETLQEGIEDLRSRIGMWEREIRIQKELLHGTLSHEDLYSAAKTIIDYEDGIDTLNYFINYLKVLIDIEQYDNSNGESPLEWVVG